MQSVLIALLIGADQLLKIWAQRSLAGRVLSADGFMALRVVRNTAVAFTSWSKRTT